MIVYSDERSIVGEAHLDAPDIRAALAGHVERSRRGDALRRRRGPRDSLEVYVPLRLERRRRARRRLEVYLDYAPVAAAIAEDSRALYLLLALGLVLALR